MTSSTIVIDDSEFLNTLEAKSLPLDDFEFNLLDEEGFGEELDDDDFDMDLAQTTLEPEPCLTEEEASSSMDCEIVESLPKSMHINAIQIQEDEARLLSCYNATNTCLDDDELLSQEPSHRQSQESPKEKKRRGLGKAKKPKEERGQSSGDFAANRRSSDVSASSTCSAGSRPGRSRYSQDEYGEALQNLAESMKRTKESRKHVAAMKRDVLTAEQRRALSLAKERLRRENERARGSAGAGGFFSSKRNSLSRNWGAYIGQVTQQML